VRCTSPRGLFITSNKEEVLNVNEKIAVHCRTKEEWDRVMATIPKTRHGTFTWCTTYPCIGLVNMKNPETIGTQSRKWYSNRGHTIISAAEYLNEGGKDVSEFKVGDRVECINSGKIGGYSAPSNLTLGSVYTIKEIIGVFLELNELGDTATPRKERFKLANKTQTTKENKMNKSIESVFAEDKVKDGNLVQRYFGTEIAENFTGEFTLAAHKEAYLKEAKKREKADKEDK
jgi:hypothetical protein